jgi:hypothetical protein
MNTNNKEKEIIENMKKKEIIEKVEILEILEIIEMNDSTKNSRVICQKSQIFRTSTITLKFLQFLKDKDIVLAIITVIY